MFRNLMVPLDGSSLAEVALPVARVLGEVLTSLDMLSYPPRSGTRPASIDAATSRLGISVLMPTMEEGISMSSQVYFNFRLG